MKSFSLSTRQSEMANITKQVQQALAESGVQNGICVVYCPHTTAGITINENADPDVVHDLLLALEDIYPDRRDFRHAEGNSAAHRKALAAGASASIPVHEGRLVLGTWQGIYFCEFDGPRNRRFMVQVVGQ